MAMTDDFEPPPRFDPRDAAGARLCGPVRKQPQGDERCTAYATATAMETWLCRAGHALPSFSVDRLFADSGGRTLPRAVKAAEKRVLDEAGRTWRGRFEPIAGPSSRRAELMCRYLLAGSPLVIAIPYFENFRADPGDDPYVPRGEVVDAHAVCIVGYEGRPSGPGYWIIQNSAGSMWGDSGCTRIKRGDPYLKPESKAFAVVGVARGGA
jgi:Papain family cysteine protease